VGFVGVAFPRVPELKDESCGWANYLKLGPVGKAHRAIDAYSIDWLRRRLWHRHRKFSFRMAGRRLVRANPRYFRPTEVETRLGDAYKAREKLGWHHEWHVCYEEIVLTHRAREEICGH
jgi:GDP-D-mannose dehydratase